MRTLSKTSRLLGAHKNASNQAAIGFSQESDWLRKGREFSGIISQRSKTKSEKSRITFDAQLKIAPVTSDQ